MPTGYTCNLGEGKETFEEFVWHCVRAMGVAVTMRDEPSDELPPLEFAPDPHYSESAKKAADELARWDAMGQTERMMWARKELAKENDRVTVRKAENGDQIRRYREALARVESWTPPTEDHVGFKKFMTEQLTESISWDDHSKYHDEQLTRTPEEVIAAHDHSLRHSATWQAEQWQKEQERAASRTAWLQALNVSIPRPR